MFWIVQSFLIFFLNNYRNPFTQLYIKKNLFLLLKILFSLLSGKVTCLMTKYSLLFLNWEDKYLQTWLLLDLNKFIYNTIVLSSVLFGDQTTHLSKFPPFLTPCGGPNLTFLTPQDISYLYLHKIFIRNKKKHTNPHFFQFYS